MDVGFVGLGHMGAPMAQNLQRLAIISSSTIAGAARLKPWRARARKSPNALPMRQGKILITMLADDPAVEGVVFGDRGAHSALRRDAIHISMSTISVGLSDHLTEAHGKAGQGYVAASVFGRPEAAAAAKLFIITAGADAMLNVAISCLMRWVRRHLSSATDPPRPIW
jgi:3-hydroxyisobutyrate dehydrogenase-like beta-hydroxyacid dehydrogenase